MLVASFFKWWYAAGLKKRIEIFFEQIGRTQDFFSIGLLVKTLFKPFKLIDSGTIKGSLDAKMRAFIDRSISRFIGAFMRSIVILIGLFVLIFQSLYGLMGLIFWLLMPILPIFFAINFALGVSLPWTL